MIAATDISFQSFVIPAPAGIHLRAVKFNPQLMDSRLRGNDEARGGGELP